MLKQILFGLMNGLSTADYCSLWMYALLGAALVFFLETATRDVHSVRTPAAFSWAFLLRDNVRRLVGSLLLIVLAFRFGPELLGFPVTEWKAVLIGASTDAVALAFKKYVPSGFLSTSKPGTDESK